MDAPAESSKQAHSVIVGDYRVLSQIGSGSFGDIFMGEHMGTSQRVAIKLETRKCSHHQLFFEYKLYLALGQGQGIPRIYRYFSVDTFNVLVMELLGPSLEELFNFCSRRFSLKTVLMLASQMFERVEFVHSNLFVHRDIKPDNFLMGGSDHSHLLYIIDFGLGKKYWDLKNNTHIRFKECSHLTGTARYASISALRGGEHSRRDDMESLGYVFMYFLRGSLPWQGIKSCPKKQKYEMIAEKKQSTKLDELCYGFPDEFASYLSYCRSLGFEEEPHYQYIRRSFSDLYNLLNYARDDVFDWVTLKQLNEKPGQDKQDQEDKDKDKSGTVAEMNKLTL